MARQINDVHSLYFVFVYYMIEDGEVKCIKIGHDLFFNLFAFFDYRIEYNML